MRIQTPEDMIVAMYSSMKNRTGRSVEEWIECVNLSGLDPFDQKAVRKWLKTEHGLLQNSQWVIAEAAAKAAGWTEPSLDEYIDMQYQGAKAKLRPIFDKIRTIVEDFGEEVSVEGRSTYIPFIRGRQFAAVAATSAVRVELGLKFKESPDSARIWPSNAPGQATHRIIMIQVEDVDDEVKNLLKLAFEQNV